MSDGEQAITQKTCTRCGATWFPRAPGRPMGCAKCHSPYWDKPRVYALKNRAPAKSRVDGANVTPDKPDTPDTGAGGWRATEALRAYRQTKGK